MIQGKNDFQYWKEMPLDYIDAFGAIPEIDLKTPAPVEERDNNSDSVDNDESNMTPKNGRSWTTKQNDKNKKRKYGSPVQMERKKRRNDFSPEQMAET